jgi:hypothetical protein
VVPLEEGLDRTAAWFAESVFNAVD